MHVQLCQQVKSNLPGRGRKESSVHEVLWDTTKAHLIFGSPAFDSSSGFLIQGGAEVAADAQYSEDLGKAVLEKGQPVDQKQTRGFIMPLFRQGQTNQASSQGVTTAINTTTMRGGRGHVLLQCLTKSLLLDVVQECKKQRDRLTPDATARLAVRVTRVAAVKGVSWSCCTVGGSIDNSSG
jgi:hypothetical protein